MSKKGILGLALFTLVVFGLIGYSLIEIFHKSTFGEVMQGNYSPGFQVLAGCVYGYLTAFLGWEIVKKPFMKRTREFFTEMFEPLKLSTVEIVFISFCAGMGEEILFRGAIQPFLGVWITAFLFVALHGYINPGNIPLTVYGLFMILVIAGLGYLTIWMGLISAITGHMVIDIVLLSALSGKKVGPGWS